MTEMGVTSYNTTDTWLDAKVSDGAIETRSLLLCRFREIIKDDLIRQYSENDGGNVGTLIICIGPNKKDSSYLYNGDKIVYDEQHLKSVRFLPQAKPLQKFISVSVSAYTSRLLGGRSTNKYGTRTDLWKSFIYAEHGQHEYRLFAKCRLVNTSKGNFKLASFDDWGEILHDKFEGEVKSAIIKREHGIWLLGYLNTALTADVLSTFTRTRTDRGGYTAFELSNNLWPLLQVPDFDYYRTHHPERFQAYMTWIENNMKNKDTFLAGIDEQFERLIK
jgi:hypothetical protein